MRKPQITLRNGGAIPVSTWPAAGGGSKPDITYESFTVSGTWSGTTYRYYQDHSLSEQFDLDTVLIEPDFRGSPYNQESYSFEIVDDAGGTIVRIWNRYNDKLEPEEINVKITQGLTYVQYVEVETTGTANVFDERTETISAVPDWDTAAVEFANYCTGGSPYQGKSPSVGSVVGTAYFRLTAEDTLAFDIMTPYATATIFFVAVYIR